jgi:hypothetical protein
MKALANASGIFLLTFFFGVLVASAQVTQSIDLQVNPIFPAPGQTISVYAQTYSFDISRADTTWTVDGKVVKEGRGIQTIDVALPLISRGVSISLRAVRGSETLTQAITVTPTVVDLVVEPETYTPLLYKGRALPTHKSSMRIVAMPFLGTTDDTEDLIYTWRVDGEVLGAASGVGRSVLAVDAAPYSRRLEVRVDVENNRGTVQGRGSVSVKTQSPQVLLYATNPLLGKSTSNVLVNASELDEEEVTITAEPYYVAGKYRESLPVTYSWKLNGNNTASTNTDTGSITLRQAGSGRGRAQISVLMEHVREALVRDSAATTFTFGIEDSGLFNF